jgi:hypothetical protein
VVEYLQALPMWAVVPVGFVYALGYAVPRIGGELREWRPPKRTK